MLRALNEACDGLDPTRMDCHVGVSSGAGLANRMDTSAMCRIFITGDSVDNVINDTERSILDGLARAPRHTETTGRLQRALDEIEHRTTV